MKLHSVVDTITNSSSVEFMIPNPDGVLNKEDFIKMIEDALFDDIKNLNPQALEMVLEFLPGSDDIIINNHSSDWVKVVVAHYTVVELEKAATEWIQKMLEVTYTDNNDIICYIWGDMISDRINNLIKSIGGGEAIFGRPV